MEARIKKLEETVAALSVGTKKLATLAVATDTNCDELRADKRLILFPGQFNGMAD